MKCSTISLVLVIIGVILLIVDVIIMVINLQHKKDNDNQKQKLKNQQAAYPRGGALRAWHGLGNEDDPGLGWVL